MPFSRLSNKIKQQNVGVFYMLLSVFTWAILDGITKELTSRYPLFEIVFFRDLVNVGCLFLFGIIKGGLSSFKTQHPYTHSIRAILSIINAVGFTYSLSQIPLADAYTLSFSAPLFMMILSLFYFNEKVHWHRWVCLAVGFLGIIVILKPGQGVLKMAGVIALGTGISYAIMTVLVRKINPNESSWSVAFYPNLASTFYAALWLPSIWIEPIGFDGFLLIISGVLAALAQQSLVLAVRLAPMSIIAPLEYSSLIWVLMIGYFFFGDIPDIYMLLGALLIIGSNLYIVFHEARFKPRDYALEP